MKKAAAVCLYLFVGMCLFGREAVIIYDGIKKSSEAYKSACYIKELLGHFPLNGKMVCQVEEYDQKEIRRAEYVFIVFEEGVPKLPRFFIDDLLKARGTLIWVHMHIEKLVDAAIDRWGLYHNSIEYRPEWQIFYKNHVLSKSDPALNAMFIQKAEKVKVWAWAEDKKGRKYPYVLKTQNLWYFADTPFSSTLEEGRYLIFADILHEVFETENTGEQKALVRVEDISPENMGYVDLKKPDPESIVKKARNLLMVRDGLASFFFHPFVPVKHLRKIIQKMKNMGWEFASVTDFPCSCRTSFLWVTSKSGKGSVSLQNQYLRKIMFKGGECSRNDIFTRRRSEVVVENVTVPPRSLFVMEALDLLPPDKIPDEKPFTAGKHQGRRDVPFKTSRMLLLQNGRSPHTGKNNQDSFHFVLSLFGLQVDRHESRKLHEVRLSDYGLIIVPQTSAEELTLVEQQEIVDFVEKGGDLITDGKTVLAEKLGIRFGKKALTVRGVRELSLPVPPLNWNPPETLCPPLIRDGRVLAEDIDSGVPLVTIKKAGRGRLLYLSCPFDIRTPYGFGRFPYFPYYLKNDLKVPFHFRRNNLEFYFDPALIFSPESSYYHENNHRALKLFLDDRCSQIKDLHRFLLNEVESVKREKGKNMEVIVTAMDTLNHPELGEDCGVNILDIIDLMGSYSFTLQVEDPSRSWAESPSRYLDYYKAYAGLVPEHSRLMFDINVIERNGRGAEMLPSTLAAGTELAAALYFARMSSGRAAIYAESTVRPLDLDMLAFVTGPGVKVSPSASGLTAETPVPCFLVGMKPEYYPRIDGKMWPFFEEAGICLPSGRHRISFEKMKESGFVNVQPLVSLDADMFGVDIGMSSYRMAYRSSLPVHLFFNRPPGRITVDDKSLDVYKGQIRFILPRGTHRLDIQRSSGTFTLVNTVGLFSSKIFFNMGIFSVLCLVSLCLYVRLKK